MKKHIIKNFVLLLLLAAVLPVYAIDFNEPRKVLISQYANAVYRDLTVLDKMYAGVEQQPGTEFRPFFLEIGKRPSNFIGGSSQRYYLQQVQYLRFDNIVKNGSEAALTISTMTVQRGSFIGDGMALLDSPTVVNLNGTNPHLYISNINKFSINLGISDDVKNIYFYSRILKPFSTNDQTDMGYRINRLYLRDVILLSESNVKIPFPSPRMMIKKSAGYQAVGTSLEFKLENPQSLEDPVLHSYYGAWELYNSGIMSNNPCPADSGTGNDRCYKVNLDCSSRGRTTEPPGGSACTQSQGEIDSNSSYFICEDKPLAGANTTGTYDANFENGCWDYQVVDTRGCDYGNDPDRLYNNNQGYYEFKVQEIYAYKPNETEDKRMTFLDQSPKTRVFSSSTGDTIPISTSTPGGDWNLYNTSASQQFIMNNALFTANIVKYSGNSNYPCYEICGGGTCSSNYIYIKDRTLLRVKENDEIVNQWPGERKLDMILAIYTVGFCPNRAERDDTTANYYQKYSTYEPNRSGSGTWLESLIVPDNSKVCMRRKVKCNYFNSGINKDNSRDKIFSTNY